MVKWFHDLVRWLAYIGRGFLNIISNFLKNFILLHQVREVSFIAVFPFLPPLLTLLWKCFLAALGEKSIRIVSPKTSEMWKPQCDSVFSEYLVAGLEVGKIKTGCGGLSAGESLTTFISPLIIFMCTRDEGKCPIWGHGASSCNFYYIFFSLTWCFPKSFSHDIVSPFLQAVKQKKEERWALWLQGETK